MKIQSSTIAMSAKTSLIEIHTKEEALKAWVGNERPDFEKMQQPATLPFNIQEDILELSEEGKKLQQQTVCGIDNTEEEDELNLELNDKDHQMLLALRKFIEALTGKKIKFYVPKKIKLHPVDIDYKLPDKVSSTPQPPQRQGWGVEYDYHAYDYEHETMSFSANGTVKTADGREINLSVQLNMSREFASRQDISIRAGDAKKIDPLVINFNSNIPGLTDEKFSFDLDSDGNNENISFVTQGSGFLALDLNSDGIINNGKELFGPNSGNGFAELAVYDLDGNQWIDENDEIYDKLRIWTKDSEGNNQLFAIGEKGIGAIYLGNINTAFSLKDNENQLNGQIQQTGIFLKEDGSAGTINHIDLAV